MAPVFHTRTLWLRKGQDTGLRPHSTLVGRACLLSSERSRWAQP